MIELVKHLEPCLFHNKALNVLLWQLSFVRWWHGLNCATFQSSIGASPFRYIVTFASCHHMWQNQHVPCHRRAWSLTDTWCSACWFSGCWDLQGKTLRPSTWVDLVAHLPGLASSSASPDPVFPSYQGSPNPGQVPDCLDAAFAGQPGLGSLPTLWLASAHPSIAAGT